jgi:hypothetical protein
MPPIPDPAAASAVAYERRLLNHCGMMPTAPTYRKLQPHPKQRPCARKSYQICLVKLEPSNAADSSTIPMASGVWVPNLLLICVTKGAMNVI